MSESPNRPPADLTPTSIGTPWVPDPRTERYARDVMISFNSHDEGRAAELYAALRAAGLSVYCSKFDIPAGDNWRNWVSRAAHNAKLLITLSSEHSYASPHVAEEILLFKDRMDESTARTLAADADRPAAPHDELLTILNVTLDAAKPWVWTDELAPKYKANRIGLNDTRFSIRLVLAGKQYVTAVGDEAWRQRLPDVVRRALLLCNAFDEKTRGPGGSPQTLTKPSSPPVMKAKPARRSELPAPAGGSSGVLKIALFLLLAVGGAVGAVFAVLYARGQFGRSTQGEVAAAADVERPVVQPIDPVAVPFDRASFTVRFRASDDRTPPERLKIEAVSGNEDLLPPDELQLRPYQPGADRTLVVTPRHRHKGGSATVTLRATDEAGNVAAETFRVELQQDPSQGWRTHGLLEVGRTGVRAFSFRASRPTVGGKWQVAAGRGDGKVYDVNAKAAPVRIEYRPAAGESGRVVPEPKSVTAVVTAAGVLKQWLEAEEGVPPQKVFVALTNDAITNVAAPAVDALRARLAARLGAVAEVKVVRPEEEGRLLFDGVMAKRGTPEASWRGVLVIDVGAARLRGAYKDTQEGTDDPILDEIPGPSVLVTPADRGRFDGLTLATADGRRGWLREDDKLVESRFEEGLGKLLVRRVTWPLGADSPNFIPNVILSGEAVRSMLRTVRPEAIPLAGGGDPFVPVQFEKGGRPSDIELFRQRAVADADAAPDSLGPEDRLAAAAILRHLAQRLNFRAEGRTVSYFNDVDYVWQCKYLEARLSALR